MTEKVLIFAVTACVSGVAHTYMAAEAIKEVCRKGGYKVMVETQGALGIEGAPDADMIAAADVVIVAADIAVVGEERFAGQRQIRTGIRTLLKTPEKLAHAITQALHLQAGHVIDL